MYKIIIFYIISILIFSCKNNIPKNQKKDISLNNIERIIENIEMEMKNTFSKFLGKKSNELLNSINNNYYDSYPISEPPGLLGGWSFHYNNKYTSSFFRISIYYKYKEGYSTERYYSEKMDWKLEDFMDEEIREIQISINKNNSAFIYWIN